MTLRLPLGLAVYAALCGTALAADVESEALPPEAPAAPAASWALQITPYLWAAGLEGDFSPFRRVPTIGIEKSFSDVIDDLNFGGFINLWGRYENFVFSGDLMYVDTTDSKVIGALPVLGPTPGLGADVDTRQFTSTVQAGYRVLRTPRFTFDVLAGARFWHISTEVAINYGPFSLSHDENFGWVDPVIGARAFYRITDKLSLQAQADLGGLDVGSKFTWQAMGTLNYILTDRLSASAGYKMLEVDYDSDGHVFDTTLSGPVLGMTYRF